MKHLVFVLVLAVHPLRPALAQDKPADIPAATVAKVTADTEEVIVSGRLDSLSDVRKAIVDAEDRFYERYNALNNSRDFDVNCSEGAATGTRIEKRTCEAAYVAEGLREDSIYGLHNKNTNVRLRSRANIVDGKHAQLQQRMRQAAETDQELQRALVERSVLAERYNLLLKKKFNGRRINWD